jgi:hypothetical protein
MRSRVPRLALLNPPLPLLRVPRTAQLRCVTGWWFDLVRLKGQGSPHFLLHTRVVATCDWHGDMLTEHTLSYSLLFVFSMMGLWGCGRDVHLFYLLFSSSSSSFSSSSRESRNALALTWCHTYLHLARTHPPTHPPTHPHSHSHTHTHTHTHTHAHSHTHAHTHTHTHTPHHTTPQSGRRRPVGARSRDQRRQLERRP